MEIRKLIEMLEVQERNGVTNVAVYEGGIHGGSDSAIHTFDNAHKPGQTAYLLGSGENRIFADRG